MIQLLYPNHSAEYTYYYCNRPAVMQTSHWISVILAFNRVHIQETVIHMPGGGWSWLGLSQLRNNTSIQISLFYCNIYNTPSWWYSWVTVGLPWWTSRWTHASPLILIIHWQIQFVWNPSNSVHAILIYQGVYCCTKVCNLHLDDNLPKSRWQSNALNTM